MPKKDPTKGAADYIGTMKSQAERLATVRKLINEREESYKKDMNDLWEEEKQLKEDVRLALITVGLGSVRTTEGETYAISTKNRFNILNPLALETYARTERCVTIDKKLLNQRFTKAHKDGKLPDWVQVEPYQTISIRSAKKEVEEKVSEESP